MRQFNKVRQPRTSSELGQNIDEIAQTKTKGETKKKPDKSTWWPHVHMKSCLNQIAKNNMQQFILYPWHGVRMPPNQWNNETKQPTFALTISIYNLAKAKWVGVYSVQATRSSKEICSETIGGGVTAAYKNYPWI